MSSGQNIKILILVASCNNPIYYNKIINKGILKTWDSTKTDNTDTYYYYGNNPNQDIDNNKILLKTDESLKSLGKRTLECFEFCLKEFPFDYIYRTNVSSYIHKKNLYEFLMDKPLVNFYCGVKGNFKGHIPFASGAGMCFSRDVIEYLVNNKYNLDTNLIDDVAIGKLLKDIPIASANRLDFIFYGRDFARKRKQLICKLAKTKLKCQLTSETIKNYHHFRCKCEKDRNVDIVAMREIHRLFTS